MCDPGVEASAFDRFRCVTTEATAAFDDKKGSATFAQKKASYDFILILPPKPEILFPILRFSVKIRL